MTASRSSPDSSLYLDRRKQRHGGILNRFRRIRWNYFSGSELRERNHGAGIGSLPEEMLQSRRDAQTPQNGADSGADTL